MTDPTPLPDELQAILANHHQAAVRRGIGLEPTEEELAAEDAKYDPRNYLQGPEPIYLQDLGKSAPIHWTAREWVLWAVLAAGVGIVLGLVAVLLAVR